MFEPTDTYKEIYGKLASFHLEKTRDSKLSSRAHVVITMMTLVVDYVVRHLTHYHWDSVDERTTDATLKHIVPKKVRTDALLYAEACGILYSELDKDFMRRVWKLSKG